MDTTMLDGAMAMTMARATGLLCTLTVIVALLLPLLWAMAGISKRLR